MKISLSQWALLVALAASSVGCEGPDADPSSVGTNGPASGSTANATGANGVGAAGSGASAGGATAGGATAGGTTAGSATAGTTGTAGSAGNTAGGDTTTTSGTGMSDAGTTPAPDGGSTTAGACTNTADMAVIHGLGDGIAQLGCEGAACAGMNILDTSKPTILTCATSKAPELGKLTDACRECFVDMTVCVPDACIGALGGMDACGITIPNTDFGACTAPAAAEPACLACQVSECQPAFLACSGLD